MTNLVNANIQTMSSKEIAELTGKMHKNVLQDIRNMLNFSDDCNISHEEYQELKDNRGYTSEILLNKRLTYVLVTGYSIVLRAKVIDRWIELESTQKQESVVPFDANKNMELDYNKRALSYERDKIKLEKFRAESELYIQTLESRKEINNIKVEKERAKLDELKNRLYEKMKILSDKNAKILAKNDIKIKADMSISKGDVPHDTITNLLKLHGIKIKAFDFNNLLIKYGYLMPNRQEVTKKGEFFGHTVKASTTVKTPYPRWYISEFTTLLSELSQLEPDIFK